MSSIKKPLIILKSLNFIIISRFTQYLGFTVENVCYSVKQRGYNKETFLKHSHLRQINPSELYRMNEYMTLWKMQLRVYLTFLSACCYCESILHNHR